MMACIFCKSSVSIVKAGFRYNQSGKKQRYREIVQRIPPDEKGVLVNNHTKFIEGKIRVSEAADGIVKIILALKEQIDYANSVDKAKPRKSEQLSLVKRMLIGVDLEDQVW